MGSRVGLLVLDFFFGYVFFGIFRRFRRARFRFCGFVCLGSFVEKKVEF